LFSLHKISVSVLAIFLFSSVSAGDPWFFTAGAGETGMSYSCAMKPGFWSAFHNQATLPFYNSLSFGVNYENRFNISELGTRTAGLIVPAGKACLAALYSHFGYSDFRRQTAGLACGLKFSEKISGGIQIDYLAEKASGEDYKWQSLTFEAGIFIIPSEKIYIGIHLYNPVPNSLRRSFLPASIRAGAGIYLSKVLFAGAEVQMITRRVPVVRMGLEYETLKNFWFRGGFSSENTSFSFGIGYLVKFVQIDLGFATHEKLGVTSSASLIFKIKNP
jgi:hypothetical protein